MGVHMNLARVGQLSIMMGLLLFLPQVRSEQSVHISAADRGNVPSTLFNLNILGISEHSGWPAFPYASWRNFHFKWQDLEPTKDQWDFARSDHDVQEARKHGVEILAVVEGIPKWAASADEASNKDMQIAKPEDLSEWANYVRTMAIRYKGQIRFYELWNEPETNRAFLREPAGLITLNQVAYQTLKSVDPAIVVVSSALSSGDPVPARVARNLDSFARAGVMKDCDVVGYHPYGIPLSGETSPRAPEDMLAQIRAVKAAMVQTGLQKPIWATEVGWYVLNDDQNPQPAPSWMGRPLEPELAAAYVARTYILGWAAGLDRIFWYCWRHGYMGLTQFNGDAKAPAVAYATVQRWLVGTQLVSCDRNNAGTWLCQLKLANGGSEFIAWTEGKSAQLDVDPGWQSRSYKTLDGREHDLSNSTSIAISDSPILLLGSQ
jgi:hypothetical protein